MKAGLVRTAQKAGSTHTEAAQAAASGAGVRPGWRHLVEQAADALGYEIVDVERSAKGLLRVFIDRRPGRAYPTGESEFVTVDDCEALTRQLQYALEVDGVAYERLEVSSPGLDRPLRREADYERFAGQEISLTLKLPFQGRKVWKGLLQRADAGWSLLFKDGKEDKVFGFVFDEVREARLVPVVDFKGRRRKTAGAVQDAAAGDDGQGALRPAATDGGLDR